MQITDRQYPYPVLNVYNNDFKNSTYKVYIRLDSDEEEIRLDIEFDLDSPLLEELIKLEKASFGIHLECGKTRYREFLKGSDTKILKKISSKDVSGDLEIVPVIILNNDINNYKSEEFVEDFENESFDLEKGSIIAIAESRKIYIEKEGDSLTSVPSIFSIQKRENLKKGLDWTDGGEKIIISVSEEIYRNYKMLRDYSEITSAISILIILPVVVEIVNEIKNDEDAYVEASWMKVIKNKIEKLKINLKSESATMIAHKILDGALEDSIGTIKKMIENEEE